ncbi:MAG: hypothetical protein JRJ29_15570 [Deltaproteobacteria bacterium]|nr:hypothetical protein [Deltaproteobacteria bacterium]
MPGIRDDTMSFARKNSGNGTLLGGYPIYGIRLGIIMLDCKFPRPSGDVGNARTFPYPVHYEILEGVEAGDLTKHEAGAAIDALVDACKRLEHKGVVGIITSCGLLIRYQRLLAEKLSIPVATSSLVLLPLLDLLFPRHKKIGIITADSSLLNFETLAQTAWTQQERVRIGGMENCTSFRKAILEPVPPYALEPDRVCREVLDLCRSMLDDCPDIGVFLLECTNLAPYRSAISSTYSIPVFDIVHCASFLATGIDFGSGESIDR